MSLSEVRVCRLPLCGRTFVVETGSRRVFCSVRCRTMDRRQRESQNQVYTKGVYRGEAYDSALELAHMQALDALGAKWTKKHGIRLRYRNPKTRREATYIPDFLVFYQGRRILQETKAPNLISDIVVQAKAHAGRAYCMTHNMEYQLVSVAGTILPPPLPDPHSSALGATH